MNTQEMVAKVNSLIAPIRVRYQALAKRERVLVLLTAIVAIGGPWEELMYAPQATSLQEISDQIDHSVSQMKEEQQIASALSTTSNKGRIIRLQQELAELEATSALQKHQLARAMSGFVVPGDVGHLLTEMLKRHPGLHLLKAESIAPESLSLDGTMPNEGKGTIGATSVATLPNASSAQAGAMSADKTGLRLYQHGLSLELTGNYLDAYAYLRDLESLPWGLRWDRVSFEVTEHPIGKLVLRLHTVSKGPEWIGA